MKKPQSSKGSALLMAIIIVVLAAGLGGSFLVVNLANSKTQSNITDQDELMAMCDAGMERARQALDVYRGYAPTPPAPATPPWTWDNVMVYCRSNMNPLPGDFDPPDAKAIRDDALLVMKDSKNLRHSLFLNYTGQVYWNANEKIKTAGTNPNTKAALATIPSNPTLASIGHVMNGTFMGWNVPFHKGAVHTYVHNNGGSSINPVTGAVMMDGVTTDNDRQVCITVTATLPNGMMRQVEAVYQLPPPPPPNSFEPVAAVTSNDDVETLGNVSIDGQDWNESGTAVVGPGVFGILSTGNITVGGASAIGGTGNPPPKKGASAGSTQSKGSSYFPSGYPDNPDMVMKGNKGDLKAAAMAAGTYFSDEASYNKALPAGGWSGQIVYVEFDPTPSFEIGGSAYNAKPSIMVIHNDSMSTSVKNTKGFFKGLLIADEINHTSAPGGLIGAEFLLSPTAASGANAFGTANTPIKFSSEVIKNLPAPNNVNTIPSKLTSYRKIQ